MLSNLHIIFEMIDIVPPLPHYNMNTYKIHSFILNFVLFVSPISCQVDSDSFHFYMGRILSSDKILDNLETQFLLQEQYCYLGKYLVLRILHDRIRKFFSV